VISDEQFEAFIDAEVTPRFQDGLTLLRATGQWLSPRTGQLTHEQSRVLVLYHESTDAKAEAVRAIVRAYMARFGQEGVLFTTAPDVYVCMDADSCASRRKWTPSSALTLGTAALAILNAAALAALAMALMRSKAAAQTKTLKAAELEQPLVEHM
jgi:hypothetical protein